MDDQKTTSDALRQVALKDGLSTSMLSKLTLIDKRTVRAWLSGERVLTPSDAATVARVFGAKPVKR